MSRTLIALTGLVVAPALALASPAAAAAPAVSKTKAAKMALNYLPGKITSTRVETVEGRTVYVFNIAAPNQPVQSVRVDGATGKVL